MVADDGAHEIDAMVAMAEDWGLRHHVYTNMTPTIHGGPESLLAQSGKHLREGTPFAGCNAGHSSRLPMAVWRARSAPWRSGRMPSVPLSSCRSTSAYCPNTDGSDWGAGCGGPR